METFDRKLEELNACKIACDWAKGKTLREIWATCERGDWMLWLAQRAPGVDIRLLTAAKAACAEFARPYMTDERSVKALDMAHAFGRGECSAEDLTAAYAAVYAAYAAADAAYAAVLAAYAADCAAANKETLRKCADKVRCIIYVEKLGF